MHTVFCYSNLAGSAFRMQKSLVATYGVSAPPPEWTMHTSPVLHQSEMLLPTGSQLCRAPACSSSISFSAEVAFPFGQIYTCGTVGARSWHMVNSPPATADVALDLARTACWLAGASNMAGHDWTGPCSMSCSLHIYQSGLLIWLGQQP